MLSRSYTIMYSRIKMAAGPSNETLQAPIIHDVVSVT